MFEQVSEYRTSGFEERWWALLRRLLTASEKDSRRWRLPREVTSLPDHMLLDIGIDPRLVPNPAAEEISRPDLAIHAWCRRASGRRQSRDGDA